MDKMQFYVQEAVHGYGGLQMRINRKKRLVILLCAVMAVSFFCIGCGKKEKVQLTVWASTDDREIVQQAVEEFQKLHKKEADFEITVHEENLENLKQTVLSDVKSAADIYNFASDQFADLYHAGALQAITLNKEKIIKNCGGDTAPIVEAVTEDGGIYAYPSSSSNGYFMYYNRAYFNDEDVKTLDGMLAVAEEKGKYVAMDWSSGWYLYSFFSGAGMDVTISEDGTHNECNFNATDGKYSGKQVAEAMLEIARSPAFKNVVSDNIRDEVKGGDVIAVVNGTWNATMFAEEWGDDCGAVKLPTYTLDGEQVQMGSFAGFKYFGINPNSRHPEWAMKLTEYLTNYDNQILRYETVGDAPANVEAAASSEVQKSVAITALGEQNQYASIQNVLDTFWEPMTVFGTYVASGNQDNRDLQEILDEAVEKIEKIPEK